jgi:hypothetical protein
MQWRSGMTWGLVAMLVLAGGVSSSAQDRSLTFTSPSEAGIDYTIQGEYLGTLEADGDDQTWGAQVIALGGGKFELVGYRGGLPGEGWSRGDEVNRMDGALRDGKAYFSSDDVDVVIDDGQMHVKYQGASAGQLPRVERKSPTLGTKPPEGAVVLFDGSSAEHFQRGRIVEENLLFSDCETKQKFGDFKLHLEFRTPFKPYARGQERGNSGVYVQNRYEVQVLDSFGLEGKNNECGGIYSIAEPLVNMCFPPLAWQTYDIDFTAARYDDDGKKVKNARTTIRHNGVVIHDDLELPHGTPGKNAEGPGPDGIYLQGHGNPVVFRNIWVVEKPSE